jgi:hypothetical protein
MPYTQEGVKKVNELVKGEWIYAGGSFDSHLNYWNIFARSMNFPGGAEKKPRFKNYCVCGQELERNCWIYNKNENRIKIIGSECINKFLDKRRTCSICGEEHRNRIVNRCNDCRWGLCDHCDKKIHEKYKVCYKCKK